MATNVGSATGYLDLDISGFLAGLQSAQSAANTQTKNMAQTIGNNISGVGGKIASVGTTLTTMVTTPIVGAGAAIVKVSADFESAMSKVSAISGAAGSDLEALNEKAKEMGATTKFSASEAADAFTYMAMAGWKTEAMLEGIDGIMNLAAADGLDLATTSDIVTDALTAFGMSASESGHFADVLAKASSSANTNVSMLGESFKYVAPVAGALGYSAEDTAIALGLMANAGIKGSQSGTALRASLSRLVSPSAEAADMMEQYGLSLTNADGSMKSLSDVMVMLRENMGDLTEAEQAQAAATIFGQEAMSGMLAIINASDEDFNNLTNQINNADGAAKQMADTMNDNFSGQLTMLKSQLEGVALQLGEVLLPHVKQFVEWISSLVEKFSELDPETQAFILKVAGIAAIVGPAVLVIGKLTSGIGGMVTAFGNLASKFGGAKSAIEGVGSAAAGASDGVSKGAASFGNLAGQALKLVAAGASFVMIGAGIKMIADSAISVADAGPGAAAAFVLLAAGAVGLTAAIVAIGGSATATAPGLLALGAAVALVSAGIALLVAALGDAMSKVLNSFSKVIDSIGTAALNAGEGFDMLSNAVVNLVNNTGVADLTATFAAVATGVSKVNEAASESSKAGQSIASFAQTVVSNAQKISTSTKQIETGFKGMSDSSKTSFNALVSNMNSAFSKAKQNMKDFAASIEESIEELKDLFENTKFSFNQHIALPHFYMTGSFNAQTGTVPSVGVNWYKSAMSAGIILDAATIFGFDHMTGKFLGGGEAGSETVVGTSSLMKMIRGAVSDAIVPIVEATYQLAKTSSELGYITSNAFDRQTQVFEEIVKSKSGDVGGGDTFVFYSNKSIDEIEAAKQMKITKRDLAEGF